MELTKIVACSLLLTCRFSIRANAQKKNKRIISYSNLVPNKETTIKIVEAIWLPIYAKEIYDDAPFVATLKNSSVWEVRGTFNSSYMFGGVPYI